MQVTGSKINRYFTGLSRDTFLLAGASLFCDMSTEMLSPTLDGRAEELLLSAHALEILARVISLAGGRAEIGIPLDDRQRRLLAVRDAIDADLRRPWKIPQLAREAGIAERCRSTAERLFSLDGGVAAYAGIYRSLAAGGRQ